MTRLVSGVITAARDEHPRFDERTAPPGPVYRRLATYCQELSTKLAALDPTIAGVEVTLTFDLPLADFDAGMALGAHRVVTEVSIVDSPDRNPQHSYPIDLISRDQRFAPNGPVAAAWQEGNILYLRGPDTRWRDYNGGTVQVQVIEAMGDDAAAALQSPTAVLPLPDDAAPAVIANLALFMAIRAAAEGATIDVASYERRAREAEGIFLEGVLDRPGARTFFTQDVWRP
jgi:hypothetical protein